jgi:hypothetical protein
MARNVPGSGAVIEPIFNEVFGVRAIKVIDGGEEYDSSDPPRLTVTGCGVPDEEALLYPIIDDDSGQIVHVRVLLPGRGYDPLRVSIIPLQDTPNIVNSFDINRIWQQTPNSPTTSRYQVSGNNLTDRLNITSDNHPKPADIPGERNPGGGDLNDRNFNHTIVYRGGKDVPSPVFPRPDERNKSLGVMANGVFLHTPDWGQIGGAPVGFSVDSVKYDYIQDQDEYDGVTDTNGIYHYQSSKLINHFSENNSVFENGFLKPFTWDIKVEFDNILLIVTNPDESLGTIEVGRIVEVIGGNGRGEVAKVVRNNSGIVERVYIRATSGQFSEDDLIIGSNAFTFVIAQDPITFPNGIFYLNFRDQAAEFGNFANNTYYFAPENIQVQRNYLIVWNQIDPSNQPSALHPDGHPMQFSTTQDGLLNQNPGELYLNSTGDSEAPAADYENELQPLFIMNADENNRIYYYCKYHRHMSGYIGDEGYMVLNPITDPEEITNNYYITDYYTSGSTIDYSRHTDGHSKILGVSFDGYPIYGPWGYNTSGNVVRMTTSYRYKVGSEIDGNRPKVTTSGTVTYTVTVSGNKFLINGELKTFLNLDRGKTYVFNQDDASNDNYIILIGNVTDGWHVGSPPLIGDTTYLYEDGVEYYIDGLQTTYSNYISSFENASTREIRVSPKVDSPRLVYLFSYGTAGVGFRLVQEGYLIGDLVQDYIYDATIGGSSLDPEYNNGPIINVSGDGSDFFKREVTVNGVRVMGAGTVGGQTAVPDAWLEKVGRMFELFTDPNAAGINETAQRNVIKTLSGDAGTYHAAQGPTLQRVARGAGSDYTPNFLTDEGIASWNLSPLFDSHVANDMVWYLNSTGDGYGDGEIDAQEVIEHVFHTLHMHGLDAVSLKMYPYISADWATGPLYSAMVEAYDGGYWDPAGYGGAAFKTDGDAFEVAAKEYLYLLNFCMFEYTGLWDGDSLAPEWADAVRTAAQIQTNLPLGYALFNSYIAPVISKPSLATINGIFGDGNTPAQDNPALAGASGYVVDIASGGSLDEFNGKFGVTPEYPNGTYAYFMLEDNSGNPVYPYVIGPEYYGAPVFEGEDPPELPVEFPTGSSATPVIDPDDGSISYVKMKSSGDSYFGQTEAKILGGEGSGATVTPVVQTITGLSLLSSGRNFATPPTLLFEGGGGQGSRGAAEIDTTGKVTSISIVNTGEFYQEPPFILITGGGGIGAKAVARIQQGEIIGIDVTDPGKGYTNPPNIIFTKLVNLKRKTAARQAFNSASFYLTGLLKSIDADDTTIYVNSTDAFPGSGELILNNEIISYSSKSRERFLGIARGLNFNYDQRVILDTSQNDQLGVSTYEFNVGDRVIRRVESSTNKVAKVYDWNPSSRELLVTFEVDELAFIDGGIPSTEDAIVQFDAGVASSSGPGVLPHTVVTVVGENIVTLTESISSLQDRAFEDDDELEGAGDGIPDLINTGSAFENQINLDGGIYNSLYGIEETLGGQNTTLFQVGDSIKDASLPFKFATIIEAGQLNEGRPQEAIINIKINPNYGNGQNFAVNEVVTGSVSGVIGTVVSWDNVNGILQVKDIVPYNTGDINVGVGGYLYKFSEKGTIVDFIVQSAGADYSAVPTLSVENIGDIQATATLNLTAAGDQIASATITNGGYGYEQYVDNSYNIHPSITAINDPGDSTGSGAVLQAVLGGENIVGNGGASYRIKSIDYQTLIRSE